MANSEIIIHGAIPTVHFISDILWIKIPLTDEKHGVSVTAFITPNIVEQFEADLVQKAALVAQIQELSRGVR